MDRWRPQGLVLVALLACALPPAAMGAEAIVEKTLNVDLVPLIDAAAKKRERFAVTLPHNLSTENAGSWTRTQGVSTWQYSVRVPTAVSMSFYADRYRLPSGAVLQVSGVDGSTAVYSPADGDNHGLWSRIQRGDTLKFELRVPTSAESQVEFALASLQAGYRGLGGGVADHPYFRSLKKSASAIASAPCIENFECHKTADNSHSSDATAAIVIGGVALCTGTLINNLRNDGTPYILTARHCQVDPSSGVTIYWDATTPCGQALGAFYNTTTTAWSAGAETVFEQQDVWMIRFSPGISAKRAYFAGWDVTGSAFVGGYSPHHAMGRARQYVEWFGQAHPIAFPGSVLGVGFDSDYWGVVNSVGSVGSGASGGGLFDPNHHVVGVASLAYLVDGPDSDGVCPATPPPVPDGATATALYNSLASVWESNADTTSSTNPVRLKSLLDPDDTGRRIADGFEMLPGVYLGASNSYSGTGGAITLTWTSGAATSCTASGGTSGDGWTGPVALNGSADVTQYQAGITTYTLRCTDGMRLASRSVRVTWNLAAPSLIFGPSDSAAYLGTTVRMFWRATAVPCVASGGVAGDGWAGTKAASGTLDVPLLQAGDVTYTMTCGTGPRAAVDTKTVRAYAPIATLEPEQPSIRVNSDLLVMQAAGGVSCVRSGGAPNDGWVGTTGSWPLRLRSAVPGTYHYTLTCYGGPHGSPAPAQATMDITYTTDAPAATLTASHTTAEIIPVGGLPLDTPRYAIEFTWQANIAPCELTYDGPGDNDGRLHPDFDHPSTGKIKSWQNVPGTYVYKVFCKSGDDVATATTTVDFTPQTPTVNIYRDSTLELARDQGFYLTWGSNTSPCVASGGSPDDGWAGPRTRSTGYELMTIRQAGTYVYTMTCGTGSDTVTNSITIDIPPPTLAFEPHPTQMLAGRSVELRWNGTVGSCVHVGDWSGLWEMQSANGWDTVYSNSAGVRTYTLRCGRSEFIEASTQITWLPSPTVDISASAATPSVNQPVTLSWTSKDADSCTAQPAEGVPEWSGTLPASGSRVVTRATPGAVGFYINCGDVIDAVVVEWRPITASPRTPSAPTVSLTVDYTTRVIGEPVTLNWTTTHAAACRAVQGVSGDAWVGALPVSGTRAITVGAPGTYTWKIMCEGAPPAAVATVSVTFTDKPSGGNPDGGTNPGGNTGGGGGGSIDLLLLALLVVSLLVRSRRENTPEFRPLSVGSRASARRAAGRSTS